MKNNRTSMEMEVTLPIEIDGKVEDCAEFVYIPFDIAINAIRKFFSDRMINLDGKDNDIWNALIDFCPCDLQDLEYNKEFIENCKELYKGSSYEEEDIEYFKESM